MKTITIFFLLISTTLIAQTNKRELYDSLKTYHYNAVFINKAGDTLSNEKIILKPTGKTWNLDKKQDLVKFYYYPNDSILSQFRDLRSKKYKKLTFYDSLRVSTGVIETDSLIWIHPFRLNQYQYTEVAPFPEVRLNKLEIDNRWDGGTLLISFGWGALKGKVRTNYQVTGITQINYMNQLLTDCWQIKGVGIHNKLGESTISYIYQKQFGFISMEYNCFDGNKIIFTLEKVELENK